MSESSIRPFSISYTERRWLLIFLDGIAITGGFLLSLYLRPDYELSWELLLTFPHWIILLNAIWFFVGYLFQVYDLEKAGDMKTAFQSVIWAGLLSMVIYNFIPYLPPQLPPSRQPLLVAILVPLLFLILSRSLYLIVFAQAAFRRRLVIIGAGWAGRTIYQAISEHAQTLYQVVGFVDDDLSKQGKSIDLKQKVLDEEADQTSSGLVIGRSKDLMNIVNNQGVTMVILAVTRNVSGELYQALTDCLQSEVDIVPMPLLYEQLTGKVPVEHIGDHWSIAMPLEHPGTRLIWQAAKRGFDLFWSIVGLIVLGLLFPIIAIAIKLESQGPILYTQERVGQYGKKFQVVKFRSMIENAEEDHAVWAVEDDPRITHVGRFLRRTHLDEFPQFWNIFKGSMSVVGPRPERPEFIVELASEIPFYRVRNAVKPGMAGWALIHTGYGASKEETLKKLQYDLYYIKHQSLWLDIYILWRTILDSISLGGR